MNSLKTLLTAACLLTAASAANSAMITTTLEDTTNGGGFFGDVTFTDAGANTVTIAADISDPINAGLTDGDILALWFDFADFSALSGVPSLSNLNPSNMPASFEFDENSVGTLGGGYNLNGTGESGWDFAIQTGINGNAAGFIQTLSFDLTITGLDASQFFNQRVGMRVQSIDGDESFAFNGGSSKLIGTGHTVPEPGTIALMALGLLGLGMSRRKS